MVSLTKQTERRRHMRHQKLGRAKARERMRAGTPAFPVHPEGYDPSAPDAKPSAESKANSSESASKEPGATA